MPFLSLVGMELCASYCTDSTPGTKSKGRLLQHRGEGDRVSMFVRNIVANASYDDVVCAEHCVKRLKGFRKSICGSKTTVPRRTNPCLRPPARCVQDKRPLSLCVVSSAVCGSLVCPA